MPLALQYGLMGIPGILFVILAIVIEKTPFRPLFRLIPFVLAVLLGGTLMVLVSPLKGALATLGILLGLMQASLHWESRLGNIGILVAVLGLGHAIFADAILFSYLGIGVVLGLATLGTLLPLLDNGDSYETIAAAALLVAGIVWGDRIRPLFALYPMALICIIGILLFLKERKLDPYPPYFSLLLLALSGWLVALLLGIPALPILIGVVAVALLVLLGESPQWAIVLLGGMTLILTNRLFGVYGVALAGMAFLLVSQTILASVFGARALLQVFLLRTGLQGSGIEITQVYAFAGLAIAFLIPLALLEIRPYFEDRMLFFVGGLSLLAFPLMLGFLASLMPLAAYLAGLMIALLVLGSYRMGYSGLAGLTLSHMALAILAAPWLVTVLALPRVPRAIGLLLLALIGLFCLCYAYFRRPVSAS